MRAQAFEKMNEKLVEELEITLEELQLQEGYLGVELETRVSRIENLIAKSKLLSDRDDDRAASVIRELNNGH